MENFKKFANFEEDFIINEYPKYSKEDKFLLWCGLLVDIRGSDEHFLDRFTAENYRKWKSFEKDIDEFLEILMEEIWDHGPWEKGVTLAYVRKAINNRLGKHDSLK